MQDVSLLDVLGRLLPALLVVVGGLLVVRHLALRQRGGMQRRIRVVARVGLSRSASVQVVQVGDLHYLVGATDQHVQLLAHLPESVIEQLAATPAPWTPDAHPLDHHRTTLPSPWTGLVVRLQGATLRRTRDPGDGHALP